MKNVLKCLIFQTKDVQFTVIEEEKKQKIFTFKKLESENCDIFVLKKCLKLIDALLKYLQINLKVGN